MNDTRLRVVEQRVNEVLDSLPTLSDDDLSNLADEWAAQDQSMRESGWRIVKQAAEMSQLQKLLDGARMAITAWASDRRTDYAGIEGLLNRSGGGAVGRQEAVPAILDAVASAVGHESLSTEEYETLQRPWATISKSG